MNWLMGNGTILARRMLSISTQPPRKILELGAGDGHLLLQVARKVSKVWKSPVEASLLDRQNLVTPEITSSFSKLAWNPTPLLLDLLDWTAAPNSGERWDLVLCNLFLHHFSDEQLRAIFQKLSQCARTFIATEPHRTPFAAKATRLLWLLGCNQVTLHDAAVSVRAGFRGHELTELWPANSGFQVMETAAGLFTHLFTAKQK